MTTTLINAFAPAIVSLVLAIVVQTTLLAQCGGKVSEAQNFFWFVLFLQLISLLFIEQEKADARSKAASWRWTARRKTGRFGGW